jgi:hypothetical protein
MILLNAHSNNASRHHSTFVPLEAMSTDVVSSLDIFTPLRLQVFASALHRHPDKAFVVSVLLDISRSATLGFHGEDRSRHSTKSRSALQNPDVITQAIYKEIRWSSSGRCQHKPKENNRCHRITSNTATSHTTVRANCSQLERQCKFYTLQSMANSTRYTYAAGQTRYVNFCNTYGLTPTPLSQYNASMFVTFLASLGLAYSTVKLYLTAIVHKQLELGYHVNITEWSSPQTTMHGIKRCNSQPRRVRLPITISIMRRL